MTLEDARRLAQVDANKAGHQLAIFNDPIGTAEDSAGPFTYIPTLALPIFITALKHGSFVEAIEPAISAPDRRADLEVGLIALYRRDPNAVKRLAAA